MNSKRFILTIGIVIACYCAVVCAFLEYKYFGIVKRQIIRQGFAKVQGVEHPEYWDVDNDGETELVVCDKDYYPIRVYDVVDGKISVIFEGTSQADVLSIHRVDGKYLICHSNTLLPGNQKYHFEKYAGEKKLVEDFYLEAAAPDSVYTLLNGDCDYSFKGESISMQEFRDLEEYYMEDCFETPYGYGLGMSWEAMPKYESDRENYMVSIEPDYSAYYEFVSSHDKQHTDDEKTRTYKEFLFGDRKALVGIEWETFKETCNWLDSVDAIEYTDIDNDSENELLVYSSAYYPMRVYDIDDEGNVFLLDEGEGTTGYISLTEVMGETLVVHSDCTHVGRQIHRFDKYINGRRVDRFYLNAEYWDNPSGWYDEGSYFIYRGERISMEEYEHLLKVFLGTNKIDET